MTFHCLIVGSRGYTDYASFKAKCDALLAGRIDIEIVSGGCIRYRCPSRAICS